MIKKNITIAIDGYSSTGKSTLAKALAKSLGYLYVDSGAMYRAITLYALDNGIIDDKGLNTRLLIDHLPKIHLNFLMNPERGFGEIFLNGKNVEASIRQMTVSQWVSPVAAISEVRRKMVSLQQAMGRGKGVVMDGRDIGSVVFPSAEIKLFLTASDDIRAMRRYNELSRNGADVTIQSVKENLMARDQQDASRSDSPLIQTEDAIAIDNSKLSIQDQVDQILTLINNLD